VFSEKARVVVVFVRPEWGKTPFTRIEETALRNRAFDNGYDFTLFVPTTTPAFVPKYVPRTRLYFDSERFGEAGLAATVAHLIQEFGGHTRPESVEERASRLKRELEFQNARRTFFRSEEDGRRVHAEAMGIIQSIRDWAKSPVAISLGLRQGEARENLFLFCTFPQGSISFTVTFSMPYTNALDEIQFVYQVWDGAPDWPNIIGLKQSKVISSWKFRCDLDRNRDVCWCSTGGPEQFSATTLSAEICKAIMDRIENAASRKGR
jgi:hypothetical protein